MGKVLYLFEGEKNMKEQKRVSVNDVANYFLKILERDSGSSITHLKLQKLVYYAQAWHLVFRGEPLFSEEIQAWVHGPVVPDLYKVYAGSGSSNLPEPQEILNVFCEESLEVLEDVWEAYGDFDGKYLEELTHQEQPWKEARKGYLPGEHCTEIISLITMKDFYTKLNSDGQN